MPLATTVILFPPNITTFSYSPKFVLINVGDTVEWEGGFAGHPLVSDDVLWTTPNSGTSFSHTFNQPGAFRFHCQFHGGPGGVGMAGEVFVSSTPVQKTFLPLTTN
jgi:plastocyanin